MTSLCSCRNNIGKQKKDYHHMLLCKSFPSHYLATFHSLKQIELAFSLNGFPVLIRDYFAPKTL